MLSFSMPTDTSVSIVLTCEQCGSDSIAKAELPPMARAFIKTFLKSAGGHKVFSFAGTAVPDFVVTCSACYAEKRTSEGSA